MSLIEYAGETLDVFDLLKESIEKLKKYEGKEKKTSYFEDKNLLGYFNLITVSPLPTIYVTFSN